MNVLNVFWTYKLYKLISSAITYNKEKKFIYPIIHTDDFKDILSKYLFTTIKEDWLGRLYCIVNPNLDENGKFDLSRAVIEFDNEDTHNNEYVKVFIYKQLALVRELFQFHNLYDYINLEFEKVGPPTEDNFLVIISLVSQNILRETSKKFLLHSILYIVAAAIAAVMLL